MGLITERKLKEKINIAYEEKISVAYELIHHDLAKLQDKISFLTQENAKKDEQINSLFEKLNLLYDENKKMVDELVLANNRISDLEKTSGDKADYQTSYNEWMKNPMED